MKQRLWGAALLSAFITVLGAQEGANIYEYSWSDLPGDAIFADSTYDGYIRDMYVGSDLDQDGLPEIIVVDGQNGGRIVMYEVTGDNTMQQVFVYGGNGNSTHILRGRSVNVGDLDGDGKGEILASIYARSSWDSTNVTLGGVYVFEWDGVVGSNNYEGPMILNEFFHVPPDSMGIIRAEEIAVGDFDNDGTQEVAWNNNGYTSEDNLYIFSVVGDLTPGGFYTVVQEAVFYRTNMGLGGSTNGVTTTNLDGDAYPEIIGGIWNNVGFFVVEASGPDTYELKAVFQGLWEDDDYPLGKTMPAFDADGDGRPELFYLSIFVGGSNNHRPIFIIQTDGPDVDSANLEIDTLYVDLVDSVLLDAHNIKIGDQDHGTSSDNWDIYAAVGGWGIADLEYNGSGDLADPNSYTFYTVYHDTADLANFAPASEAGMGLGDDLDGDGKKEIVAPFVAYVPADEGILRVFEWGGTGVEEWTILPQSRIELYPNRPNPFTNMTRITFRLPERMEASLVIYDIRGRRVAKLVDGVLEAGEHTVQWNGLDENGRPVSAGTYFYRLTTPMGTYTRSMLRVK